MNDLIQIHPRRKTHGVPRTPDLGPPPRVTFRSIQAGLPEFSWTIMGQQMEGFRTQVLPETLKPATFLQKPWQSARVKLAHARHQQQTPQLPPPKPAGQNLRILLTGQDRLHVFCEDPPAPEFSPESGLRQIGLPAVKLGRLRHRLVKVSVLKGMQSVVVNKDADRPLRGQFVGRVIQQMPQFMPGIILV